MRSLADIPCRSCRQIGLSPVLDLGQTPLANSLLTSEQLRLPEDTFPLDLAFCPRCALVQITETVSPERLFRDYAYFSSFSDTMLEHAASIAGTMVAKRKLGPQNLVVEIASNDGYLLKNYVKAGVPVLGIEPARNIACVAEERGVRTRCDFFGAELASELAAAGQRADVLHANNVLAHVADLDGVVRGIATILSDDGMAVIEAPYVVDLVQHVEFDTIYHEHLCYFSLTSLSALFGARGLTVVDVEWLAIHGGSLRVCVQKDPPRRRIAPAVRDMLRREADLGVDKIDFYSGFGRRVEKLRDELVALLSRLKRERKRIAVYGASAKGSTLLNYFGLGRELLDYIVDRSTAKQGKFTPGTHLEIHSPERLVADMPDYCLLLTWNFADEILRQQNEYRRRGGRFIIPIPEVRVA